MTTAYAVMYNFIIELYNYLPLYDTYKMTTAEPKTIRAYPKYKNEYSNVLLSVRSYNLLSFTIFQKNQ